VYLLKNGSLQLLDKDPGGFSPNGLAFSPDEGAVRENDLPVIQYVMKLT
jgi:hypothetical protein